jgi:hypothetical protein
MKVMHLIVKIEGSGMAACALPLPKENLFASQLTLGGFGFVEPAGEGVHHRRWREIQHVLHWSHVADLDTVENVHAFLNGLDSSPLGARYVAQIQ